MQHIRPHKALMLFPTHTYVDRLTPLVLPDKFTPRILETCILIALLRHVGATKVFEFGTFRGINTLNIAANMDQTGQIYTLDLDEESFRTAIQHPNDAAITKRHFEWETQLAFLGTKYEAMVTRLFGNSRSYDFAPFRSKMNMVWVDGGHDLETVQSDTRNAFEMIDRSRPGVIAWHDYGNPHYRENTEFLDVLSTEHRLQHVEDTMVVFWLDQSIQRKTTA